MTVQRDSERAKQCTVRRAGRTVQIHPKPSLFKRPESTRWRPVRPVETALEASEIDQVDVGVAVRVEALTILVGALERDQYPLSSLEKFQQWQKAFSAGTTTLYKVPQ